jgi:hypothetical protein
LTRIHSLDATIWPTQRRWTREISTTTKKSTDFGFAVNHRQIEVESEYRKKAEKLDAEYHQPGGATTFKSILKRVWQGWWGARLCRGIYCRGLVGCLLCRGPRGYPTSLEAPRVHLDVGVNRAWGYSFARGFARVILDRERNNLDPALGTRIRGSELDADAEFNFFHPPSAVEDRS